MSYTIEDIRKYLSPQLKEEIIQFWLSENALNLAQAQERVEQVMLIIRKKMETASRGPIIGICTIQPLFVQSMNLTFYNSRSFVSSAYRSQGLVKEICNKGFHILNQEHLSGKNPDIVGILADIENPLLQQRAPAIWKDMSNLTFIGISPRGNHIRIAYFDEAMI